MTKAQISKTQKIFDLLSEVKDPEIPVINVIEMGIVKDVTLTDSKVSVTITPTYSGCPAMNMIATDIKLKLQDNGYTEVKIIEVLSPAWTTDLMTEEAKAKLKAYGIAPPNRTSSDKSNPVGIPKECPNCASSNTKLKSHFGSTPCKALYVCEDCLEPFDYFKCH
ncbi:MAG TPA: phenylacetate-CoA oxygenase subunit PaaJ [Flavobacteriales bacterium]|nr:phenylacetate-CoA oxygenase subunit PaaJ [Flavobacteriales bacterium]